MRDLIILGTGVHGGEMAHIVARVNREAPTWNLLGHVAPRATADTQFAGNPILGSFADLAAVLARWPQAGIIADNEYPRDPPLPEARLISLIDPTCFVHPTASIGPGCVLFPHCFVGLNAKLGRQVFMLAGCIINHDDVLGDCTVAASAVTLAGCVQVESGVYLGQSCSVRQFLRIGRNALVGMGAVVVKDVPAQAVMAGNPARKLRDR